MKKNIIARQVICCILLSCITIMTHSQTQKITGVVFDTNNEPVLGASIVIKGTQQGTVTDINGKFQLSSVAPRAVLTFSFVGYKTQEISLKGRNNIKVFLEEDALLLSELEVVAVGYGDVKKRDLTGAISKANMGDLIKTPVSNIANSLGGRIAGVQVTSPDGGLTEEFNIVIRGVGSLTQSTEPLYVIDGFPSESSNMGSLNPNDIQAIDVLKDASATAIYGARGANGVIVITTRKGNYKEGVSVNYRGSMTLSTVAKQMDLMSGYDFVKLQQDLYDNTDEWISTDNFISYYLNDGALTMEDYNLLPSYDWQDELYRTTISHNHYINMTGGNKNTRYSVSLSYNNRQGVIIASDLTKYQGRFNLTQKIKNFTIEANANYSKNIQNGANPSQNQSISSLSLLYSTYAYRPVSPSGNDLLEEIYDDDGEIDMANDYRFNPIISAQNEYRRSATSNLISNVGIEWELVKNLKLKTQLGYTNRDIIREEFNGCNTATGNSHPKNPKSRGINAVKYQTQFVDMLNENTLSYSLRKNEHNFTGLAGITFQKQHRTYNSVSTDHITSESFGMAGLDKGNQPVVGSSIGENRMMSYLGRITYNYDSKYYLTASFRVDGSSKFPPHARWGYFPSASLAWAFGREAFISDTMPWLSNGKIRVSWGLTGNNRIGNYDYYAKLVTDTELYKYPWDGSFTAGYVLTSLANEKLKWETSYQYDFGIDLGFLNNRINLTMDYYIKETKDLLLNADISGSSGFAKSMLNIGQLRNKGLEISLETENIKTKNFEWTSNFNIAFNKNEIVALSSGQSRLDSYVSWNQIYNESIAYVSPIGQAAGQMYGFRYDGTFKYEDFDITTNETGETVYTLLPGIPSYVNNPMPGDPKYKDLDDSGTITDADRTTLGNGHPLYTGGFTNNFLFKNWDLNIFLQWSYGNDLLNANRLEFENPSNRKNTNQFVSYNNRWTSENPNSNMVRANAQGSRVYSSLYIEDGSYLKLKNISLGYTFNVIRSKSIGISSARIFVSAENIATLTSYSGLDPEVSTRHSILTPGFDWSAYPRSLNISFGVDVKF